MNALGLIALLLPALALGQAGPVAGSVVRSKEWKIKRAPQREEEFIGEVRYQSGPTRFSADWALFQHEAKLWQARGRVAVTRTSESGEVLDARGERAQHDQTTEKGWLRAKEGGLLVFTRTPAGEAPDHGETQRLAWQGKNDLLAFGQVHLWGPRLEAWADEAHWRGELLELSGSRPVLHRLQGDDWTGAVKADRITASRSAQTVSADGKTAGWLVFKKDPLGRKK